MNDNNNVFKEQMINYKYQFEIVFNYCDVICTILWI